MPFLGAEKFDAIVVGAGPAGSSAAIIMARAGLNVVILERGEYPGAKNMFGGVMYRWPLEKIIPRFWEKAPIERFVTDYRIMMLSKNSGITLSFKNLDFSNPPYNSFTVSRSKFDRWYASQAEASGALLITSATITDVIKENGRVVGVRSGEGEENELYADVVVGADGVMSTVATKSGLCRPNTPKKVALGVKEVYDLPQDKIETRFGLKKNQGAAITVLGATRGKMGGGFVYTNRDSIGIGFVMLLDHLMELRTEPYIILDEFESHPLIAPFIEGGKPKEYSAHMIPEAGYYGIPKLFSDGVLLVGDAAFLCDILYYECTNLAMASGIAAAETIIEARRNKDFSAKQLSKYRDRLNSSYVIKELKKRRHVPNFMVGNPRLFREYPELLNESIREILTVDEVLKERKRKKILASVRTKIGYTRIIRDAIAARRLIP